MVKVPVGMTNMPAAMKSRPGPQVQSSGPSRFLLATPNRKPMGRLWGTLEEPSMGS